MYILLVLGIHLRSRFFPTEAFPDDYDELNKQYKLQ